MVKETGKNHTRDPSVDNHSIYFPNFGIMIALFLYGVLSYLLKSNLLFAMLEEIDEIYLMNPEG